MPLLKLLLGISISLFLILVAPINNGLAQDEQPDFTNQNCYQCHADIEQYFSESAHSDLSCMVCHTNISSSHLQGNEKADGTEVTVVSPQNVPETCGACHNQELNSYMESVHGHGLLLGTIETANCIDCHGSHNALAVTDADSSVSDANLPETCGKCHVASMDNFAAGTEHKSVTAGTGAAENNTFKFFVWLTILTVIGLILHMEVELLYLLKIARRRNESQ